MWASTAEQTNQPRTYLLSFGFLPRLRSHSAISRVLCSVFPSTVCSIHSINMCQSQPPSSSYPTPCPLVSIPLCSTSVFLFLLWPYTDIELLEFFMYILDINPSSDISFTNIVSHSVGCRFVLLIVFFSVQKFLVFALSVDVLFIFAFVSFAWEDKSHRQILLRSMSKNVLPIFYFMVLDLTFRSSIYFESNFEYDKRKCSNFILLHVTCSFSIFKRLTEETLFPSVHSYLLCHKLMDHMCMGLFLDATFCSVNLCLFVFIFVLTILLWILCLCSLKWGWIITPFFFSFSQDYFGYVGSSVVPCEF